MQDTVKFNVTYLYNMDYYNKFDMFEFSML